MSKNDKPQKGRVSTVKAVLAGVGVVTLVVGAVLATQRFVAAQADGPSDLTLHPEKQDEIVAARWADTLGADLNLTPEQSTQVAALFKGFREDMQAMREASTGQMGGQVIQRLMRVQQLDTDVLALLNPEQAEIYQVRREERVSRIRNLATSPDMKPMLPNAGRRAALLDRFLENKSTQE